MDSKTRTQRFWRLLRENIYSRRYREALTMQDRDSFTRSSRRTRGGDTNAHHRD